MKQNNEYQNNEEAYRNFNPSDISIRHNTKGKRDSYTLFVPKDLVRRPLAKDENGNTIELTATKKNGDEYTYKQRINFVVMPQGMQLKDETNGAIRDVSGWSFVPYHKAVNNSFIAKDCYEIGLLADEKNSKTGEDFYIKLNPPRGSKEFEAGDSLITRTIPMINQLHEQGAKAVPEADKEDRTKDNSFDRQNMRSSKERVTERAINASKSKSNTEKNTKSLNQNKDIQL